LNTTVLLLAAHFEDGAAKESAALDAAWADDRMVPFFFTWEALAMVTFTLVDPFDVLAMFFF
jgi:hypothetical protein